MKKIYVKTREGWRDWLTCNHDKQEKGIWLIFYKKASGQPTLEYEDSVEDEDRFWSRIQRNVKLWKLTNYEIWFNRLKKVAENITNRFAKG